MQKIPVNFKDGVIIDGNMWVFDNALQAMCKLNINTNELESVATYSEGDYFEVSWIFYVENCMYLVSSFTFGMLKFSLDNYTFEIVESPNQINDTKANRVVAARIYKNVLWLFPHYYSGNIWCYDIEKEKYVDKTELLQTTKTYTKNALAILYPYIAENAMWIVPYGSSYYIKYNMDTEKISLNTLREKNAMLLNCIYDGSSLYVTRCDSDGIYYLASNGKLKALTDERKQIASYSLCVNWQDLFVFLSRNANNIAFLDPKTKEVAKVELAELSYAKEAQDGRGKICSVCQYEDRLYLFAHEIRKMFIVRKSDFSYQEVDVHYTDDYNVACVRGALLGKQEIRETKDMNLNAFISFCKESK